MVGFRGFMATFPTGVAVLTAVAPDGTPWGMTCTALCSVSAEPPTLLACLRDGSPTLAAVRARRTFALNLLRESRHDTARLFASGRPDRFEQVRWSSGPETGGPHLDDDAHAVADCRLLRADLVGDHYVVFGEVLRTTALHNPDALVYGHRRYGNWPG